MSGAVTAAVNLRAAANLELRKRDRARYWNDPEAFCREQLGYEPTPDQVGTMISVRDNPMTAVVAANGTGKTNVAAAVVCWFMECAPRTIMVDGTAKATQPICYTTAPTLRQVVNNLWKEIRQFHEGARPPLIGRLLPRAPEWVVGIGGFAQGIAATGEESIKGQHAPYLLIVVDEAQGILPSVFLGIDTMLKGRRARLLLIGNASQIAGRFFNAFHDDAQLYSSIKIPARRHPNVLAGLEALGIDWHTWKEAPYGTHKLPDEFEDSIPGAVSLFDLERLKISYGIDTPAWQVVVEGEFPDRSDRNLIWLPWVDRARGPHDVDNPLPKGPLPDRLRPLEGKWAGLDVARFGNDRSCLVKMTDNVVESVEVWQGHELYYTAGRAHEAVKHGYTVVYDEGGLGAGLTSHFTQDGLRIGTDVIQNNAGNKPDEAAVGDVRRMRDQLWIDAATYLRAGHVDLSQLPLDQFRALKGEWTAVEYDMASDSRRTVDSKDDLKKRIGRSPDLADAANLALHRPPAVRAWRMVDPDGTVWETMPDGTTWVTRPGGEPELSEFAA